MEALGGGSVMRPANPVVRARERDPRCANRGWARGGTTPLGPAAVRSHRLMPHGVQVRCRCSFAHGRKRARDRSQQQPEPTQLTASERGHLRPATTAACLGRPLGSGAPRKSERGTQVLAAVTDSVASRSPHRLDAVATPATGSRGPLVGWRARTWCGAPPPPAWGPRPALQGDLPVRPRHLLTTATVPGGRDPARFGATPAWHVPLRAAGRARVRGRDGWIAIPWAATRRAWLATPRRWSLTSAGACSLPPARARVGARREVGKESQKSARTGAEAAKRRVLPVDRADDGFFPWIASVVGGQTPLRSVRAGPPTAQATCGRGAGSSRPAAGEASVGAPTCGRGARVRAGRRGRRGRPAWGAA